MKDPFRFFVSAVLLLVLMSIASCTCRIIYCDWNDCAASALQNDTPLGHTREVPS